MTETTNPRKVIQAGNNLAVTLPNKVLEQWGIEKGDRYVLEKTETGFAAHRVEWRQV